MGPRIRRPQCRSSTAAVKESRGSADLDFSDAGLDLLDDGARQRRVVECRGRLLSFGDHPFQEINELLALGRVRLMFVHQQPVELYQHCLLSLLPGKL